MRALIPNLSLVVLIGAGGLGKTRSGRRLTWACSLNIG
jgi:hypothetical protein